MAKHLLLLLLIVCGPVQAVIVTYTNESDFLSATTPNLFESFEDEAPTEDSLSIQTDVFEVSITQFGTGDPIIRIWDTNNPQGAHATDGTQFLGNASANRDGGGQGYRLDFILGQPVNSIAFDIIDGFEGTNNGSQSNITLALVSGELAVIGTCPPCLPGGSEVFFGIITSEAFTEFSITSTAWADGVAYDRFQFTVVPIPTALWLFGSGLLGLIGIARKKAT